MPGPPRLPPFEQRPVAGEELVELGVRGLVDGERGSHGTHAVAGLDLVGIRQLLAGQHARVRRAPGDLVAQPAVRNLGEQRLPVGCELLGRNELLGVDLRLQLGRAVVRVDQAVDVPPEPQPEHEIALGEIHAATNSGATSVPARRSSSATAARPVSPMSSVRSFTYIATNSSAVSASIPRPNSRA